MNILAAGLVALVVYAIMAGAATVVALPVSPVFCAVVAGILVGLIAK